MNKALKCKPEEALQTMAFIKQIQELRAVYRHHLKGWTNDKGKTMKHVASIPIEFLFHPEYKKYFDKNMDAHEDRKHTDAFLKKFPQFDLRKI